MPEKVIFTRGNSGKLLLPHAKVTNGSGKCNESLMRQVKVTNDRGNNQESDGVRCTCDFERGVAGQV
jgi:hypothetical protein